MHFYFSRIVLLQFLDYTDFFKTKFSYSSVNPLITVEEIDRGRKHSDGTGDFFNSLQSQE